MGGPDTRPRGYSIREKADVDLLSLTNALGKEGGVFAAKLVFVSTAHRQAEMLTRLGPSLPIIL